MQQNLNKYVREMGFCENFISQTQFQTGDFLSQYYLKHKIGATRLRRTFSVCETTIFFKYIYIFT